MPGATNRPIIAHIEEVAAPCRALPGSAADSARQAPPILDLPRRRRRRRAGDRRDASRASSIVRRDNIFDHLYQSAANSCKRMAVIAAATIIGLVFSRTIAAHAAGLVDRVPHRRGDRSFRPLALRHAGCAMWLSAWPKAPALDIATFSAHLPELKSPLTSIKAPPVTWIAAKSTILPDGQKILHRTFSMRAPGSMPTAA